MSNTEKERRQSQSDTAKQSYRAKEAAEYLGVSPSTIWLYAREGKLTAIKLSTRVTIFKKEDLDRFINANVEVA